MDAHGRRRVFVPQALGANEFLRVTWHEGKRVLVFSHWEGDRCVAATPVRVEDIGELAELTVAALAQRGTSVAADWGAPQAADVVHLDGDLDVDRSA